MTDRTPRRPPEEDPDVRLMMAARDGDDEAFAELMERHQDRLVRFFHRKCWDRHTAEDLAVEVFMKLHRSRERYHPRAKFTTYLYSIARNHFIDHLRTGGARARPVSLDRAVTEDGGRLGDLLPDDAPRPDQSAHAADLRKVLVETLAELPEEQQTVFQLAEEEGLPYKDISEALQIPVGTVKSRMHAVMTRLRAALSRVLEHVPGEDPAPDGEERP